MYPRGGCGGFGWNGLQVAQQQMDVSLSGKDNKFHDHPHPHHPHHCLPPLPHASDSHNIVTLRFARALAADRLDRRVWCGVVWCGVVVLLSTSTSPTSIYVVERSNYTSQLFVQQVSRLLADVTTNKEALDPPLFSVDDSDEPCHKTDWRGQDTETNFLVTHTRAVRFLN